MRNHDTALGPPASTAGRRSPASLAAPSGRDIGRQILHWALHGPPWTYVALAVGGLAAALLSAGLKG